MRKYKKIILGIGSIMLLVYILSVSLRGLLFYDEGYIVYGAKRVLEGLVPYRDFHFAYTPLSLYLTALSFKILGISLLSERILMILVQGIGAYTMYILLKPFIKNTFFIILGLLGYIFWGIGHINFAWPVMFAIPLGMIHSIFLYKFFEKKSSYFLLLAGVFATITFLFKQNFGLVLGIQMGLVFLFIKEFRNIQSIFFYCLGIVIAMLPYAAYLFFTNSLGRFIDDFYTYSIMRIIIEKTLDTPFLYEDSFYGIFMKLFFYILPFYISSIAFIKALKNNRIFLIVIFLVVLYYLVGIRPTTDYPHLVPLLALSTVLLPFIIAQARNGIEKNVYILFSVLFVGLGLWTSLFKNYYKYEQPLLSAKTFMPDKHLNIWVWKDQADTIEVLRNEITKKTKANEAIFVYHYSPFIYFVTERGNVSAYDLHPSNEQTMRYNEDVIANLKTKHTPLVVTIGKIPSTDKQPLSLYIQKNFVPGVSAGKYLIWHRKNTIR